MIKRIIVNNFKCFRNLSVDCTALNLFTGVNGMGKSTMIQALLMLRQTSESSHNENFSKVLLNGHYISMGSVDDITNWYHTDGEMDIYIEEDDNHWECRYIAEQQAMFVNMFHSDKNPSVLAGEGFEYISAERLGPRRYYDNLESSMLKPGHVGVRGENTIKCLYELGSDVRVYDNIRHPLEKSKRLDLQTNAWMSEISPGLRVQAVPYMGVDLMGLRYTVNSSVGEESTNAIHMGFGVSYVLPIVVALLKARRGELLILENPEAHLHPKGQRKMGELIAAAAANGVQIIIETHSDHILNGIRLAVRNAVIPTDQVALNYFYQYMDQDGVPCHEKTSPRILADGSLSNWPDGFFDEWDKAIDLLF